MADIDVVRSRSRIWPWIIGLIALALLVWFLMGMMGAPGTEPYTTPGSPGVSLPSLEPLAAVLQGYGLA